MALGDWIRVGVSHPIYSCVNETVTRSDSGGVDGGDGTRNQLSVSRISIK